MAKFTNWLKNATTNFFDPQRKSRVRGAAEIVADRLKQQRNAFDLGQCTLEMQLFAEDVPEVAEEAFGIFLGRVWSRGAPGPDDKRTLTAIAKKLSISAVKQREVEQAFAIDAFRLKLQSVVVASNFADSDAASLLGLAEVSGVAITDLMSLPQMRQSRDQLSISLFNGACSSGSLAPSQWACSNAIAARVGIPPNIYRSIIQPIAQNTVNATVAGALLDGVVTDAEYSQIDWLLNTIIDNKTWASQVRGRLQNVRLLQSLRLGRLPSVAANVAGIRSGEIVHARFATEYVVPQTAQNGRADSRYQGEVIITDSRLLFVHPSKSVDLNHRRVISVSRSGHYVHVQASSRGGGFYRLPEPADIAFTIYDVAVRKVNQSIIQSMESAPSRHIPREVRQRVWQQYAGRCADCGSDQYLEFDHIVPVARGGNNGEQNVQLLCRKCNGLKSNFI